MDDRQPTKSLAASLAGGEASLVDVIDSLVDKGVVLQGDVALGIAGIDLITLKLAALLVSAERLEAPTRPGEDSAIETQDAPRQARDAGAGPSLPHPAGARVEAALPAPASPATRSVVVDLDDLEGLDAQALKADARQASAPVRVPAGRWDVDPDDVRRSVMKLVLTLVEVIRQLLERRAIRQMEAERLSDVEVERLGRSLHELEQTVLDLAAQAGLDPADLNLDLGPLGRLL